MRSDDLTHRPQLAIIIFSLSFIMIFNPSMGIADDALAGKGDIVSFMRTASTFLHARLVIVARAVSLELPACHVFVARALSVPSSACGCHPCSGSVVDPVQHCLHRRPRTLHPPAALSSCAHTRTRTRPARTVLIECVATQVDIVRECDDRGGGCITTDQCIAERVETASAASLASPTGSVGGSMGIVIVAGAREISALRVQDRRVVHQLQGHRQPQI